MPDPHHLVSTVEAAKETLIHQYLNIFAVSFLFYDHLITFGIEVEYFWRRPLVPSAGWFFLNRYVSLLGNAAVTIQIFYDLSPASCKGFNFFRELFLYVNVLIVGFLLTLRTYAIYNRSKRILSFMLGCAAVLVGISCWFSFVNHSDPTIQAVGCYDAVSRLLGIRYAAAWETNFAYDSIVFFLTMYRTWEARRGLARRRIDLMALILRDGAIYYLTMALANFANILTFYAAGPFLRGSLSSFASTLSVTLMSRLMLNLHQTADTTSVQVSSSLPFHAPGPSHNIELSHMWPSDLSHGSIPTTKSPLSDVQTFDSDRPPPVLPKP